MPTNIPAGEGNAGHVSGAHSSQSDDQVPSESVGKLKDLTNQKVKVVSGRFSPKSHLERAGMKKKK